jgi:hypothetical protein
MFSRVALPALMLAAASLFTVVGCAAPTNDEVTESSDADLLSGPGNKATDKRTPELGNDVSVVRTSKISMAQGVAEASKTGPVIEAKFELGDDGKLSLSLYPAAKGIAMDAERNLFQELAGDPTVTPFKGGLETFDDQEHLTRSSRDLTLVQLSKMTLAQAVAEGSKDGLVYWTIPTIRNGRAGYGVYTLNGKNKSQYRFIDGQGSRFETRWWLEDLGAGPGSKATDARTPELGKDLTVVRQSKITMGQALRQLEGKYGPMIEAKFELGDDGKLSLSLYPTGKGIDVDAERNTFSELSGDPTAKTFTPKQEEFKVPDVEHLTRSARDLTLVQTAGLSLREAVDAVEWEQPGGFVYWAIPTIRDTRSGYGVYVLDCHGKSHYYFVS